MKTNKWHNVTTKDQKRITCQERWNGPCAKPATLCEHVEWNTGNTEGISFFYYCGEHAKLAKMREHPELYCMGCGGIGHNDEVCQ